MVASSQDILNEIIELKVEALYVSETPDNERKEYIKLTKQKLRLIKKNLRDEQKEAKQKWDARKGAYEKSRQEELLQPLNLVDGYISELEINLKELETAVKFDKPLPQPPEIKTIIFPNDNPTDLLSHEEAMLECHKRNNALIEWSEKQAQWYSKKAKALKKEAEELGFFGRGKRKKLEEEVDECRRYYNEYKKDYLMGKYLIGMQEALDVPLCKEHFIYLVYDKEIVHRDDAVKELKELKDRLTKLETLKAKIEESENMVEMRDFLSFTEKISSAHHQQIEEMKKIIKENRE